MRLAESLELAVEQTDWPQGVEQLLAKTHFGRRGLPGPIHFHLVADHRAHDEEHQDSGDEPVSATVHECSSSASS